MQRRDLLLRTSSLGSLLGRTRGVLPSDTLGAERSYSYGDGNGHPWRKGPAAPEFIAEIAGDRVRIPFAALVDALSSPAKGLTGVLNVTDPAFGAKGDGTINPDGTVQMGSDDTNAVQAAIDYALQRGIGTIYFPPGIFCFSQGSQSLNPKTGNLRFLGSGMGASILCWDEGSGIQPSDPGFKALFRNNTLDRKGTLSFDGLQFRGRFLDGRRNTGGPALFLDYYLAISLYECRFFRISNMATACEAILQVEVHACQFDTVMRDMCRFRSSSSVIIWGNHFQHGDDDAIALHQARYVQGSGRVREGMIVANNHFEDVCGIHILGARMAAVFGNILRRCKVHGVAVAYDRREGPNPMFGITITNNQIFDMLPRPPFRRNSQVGITVSYFEPQERGSCEASTSATQAGRGPAPPYAVRDTVIGDLDHSAPSAYGIIISQNQIMRTLPPIAAYTEWGYGPCLSENGWVDSTVLEEVMRPWRAIGIPYNAIGLIVSDNYIATCKIAIGVDKSSTTDSNIWSFSIRGNFLFDFDLYGVCLDQSCDLRIAGSVSANTFDGDPYHVARNRRSGGRWIAGLPVGVYGNHVQGVTVEGNRFRNLYQPILGSSYFDARGNLLDCEPHGIGYDSENRGIGNIPHSGPGWRYQIVECDPGRADYDQLKNYCPLEGKSCPTTGFFVTGHFVRCTEPASNDIFGWLRVTTGREHLPGTDWKTVALR